MRHQTVYPITNFKFGQKSAKVEKDTSVSARMSRMRNKYETEGPRRSVEAVLVVHQVREEKRSGGKGKINNTRRSEQERNRERETEREREFFEFPSTYHISFDIDSFFNCLNGNIFC